MPYGGVDAEGAVHAFESRRNYPNDQDSREPNEVTPELAPLPGTPLVVPREEHSISRKQIDPDALKVMYRLIRYGQRAFLVGGGVRDLLLGRTPNDFDVGTDAPPERVRQLFRNSRIIGRRFRIGHVFFGGNKVIEVATFRALSEQDPDGPKMMLRDDNLYGDPQSDAVRRDLTINGLFYDPDSYSIIDYVGGIADLKAGIIRFIGDPDLKVQEDPVRMIRAIRHAARTGFRIEEGTWNAIVKFRDTIELVPKARVAEELSRELQSGSLLESFRLLDESGLLRYLFPALASAIDEDRAGVWNRLEKTLHDIDAVTRAHDDVPIAILYLAIVIGNITNGIFAEFGWSGTEVALDYFAISPAIGDETLPRRKKSRRRRRGRDEEETPEESPDAPHPPNTVLTLEQILDALLRPVGTSRKERETMELLLHLRREMIVQAETASAQSPIAHHPAFREALLLLRLTAHDENTQEALIDWQAAADTIRRGERRHTRTRHRRRRR